jgi:cytochrome P450
MDARNGPKRPTRGYHPYDDGETFVHRRTTKADVISPPSGIDARARWSHLSYMDLPPGPPLPAAVQTVFYLTRPIEYLTWCQRRYGDTFTVDTLLFGPEVILTHPDDIKRVFTGDPDVLHAGAANAPLEPLLGPRSVLLLDGPEHIRQRRLVMPPFHGERMVAYGRVMREAAERMIARFPEGRPFSLHPLVQRATLEIILRTIFGAEDEAEVGALRDTLSRLLDRITSPATSVSTLPPLRKDVFGFSPWARFKREVAGADALIHARIARRREEAPRDDVLSMLLQARDEHGRPMTDAELRDELVTLLVAGHETTATMLCWAFDLILSHPEVRARLAAEIAGAGLEPAAIARLPYLDAVIKEVLRMRPVIPAVGRRLTAPMELRGRRFPEGALLVPTTFLAHHDPATYPEPHTFRPERFLDAKPDPYAWFPFGGGARRCLGMAFALYEMKIVIATVLAGARLRKARPGPARVRMRAFTFAPEGGTTVVAGAA